MLCTVVMPAYNEEGCIAPLLAGWTTALQAVLGDGFRILVINDGSRDGTGNILDALAEKNPRLVVRHQKNQGHGATVVNGYKLALEMGSDYIFQTDSDDQFEPGDFIKLWTHREESRFILGVRQNRQDALHRLVISRSAAMLICLIFGVRVRDGNIPFRLIKSEFLAQILPLIPAHAFAPNLCLSIVAAKKGEKPLNILVRHKARKTGTVSIVRWSLIKACARSLRQLVELRLSPGMRG